MTSEYAKSRVTSGQIELFLSRLGRWSWDHFRQLNRLGFFGLFLSLGTIFGCGSDYTADASRTTQVGRQTFPCIDYSLGQITQALRGMPEGTIEETSFRVGRVDRVKNHLAGIPQTYLEVLYAARLKYKFHIAERSLPRSGAGVTMGLTTHLVGGAGDPLSLYLTTDAKAADFALQHEVGHAVEGTIRLKSPNLANGFSNVYAAEGSNANVGWYAKTNSREYFAEAFASFYCSKAAQDYMAAYLPRTYSILKANLAPATFDQPRPAAEVTDVWMQLIELNNSKFIEVSVAPSINKVALCKGNKVECTKSQAVFATFGVSPTKIPGRTILRSENSIILTKDLQVTVLVYDGANKIQGTKSVRFASEEGN